MKIIKTAKGFHDSEMHIDADVGGDFLPSRIIITLNDKKYVYTEGV